MGRSKELFMEMREHDMQWGKPVEFRQFAEDGEMPRDFWNYSFNPITGYAVRQDEPNYRAHNKEYTEMQLRRQKWNKRYER